MDEYRDSTTFNDDICVLWCPWSNVGERPSCLKLNTSKTKLTNSRQYISITGASALSHLKFGKLSPWKESHNARNNTRLYNIIDRRILLYTRRKQNITTKVSNQKRWLVIMLNGHKPLESSLRRRVVVSSCKLLSSDHIPATIPCRFSINCNHRKKLQNLEQTSFFHIAI